jgi:uncharacterized protein (DUF2141 family)
MKVVLVLLFSMFRAGPLYALDNIGAIEVIVTGFRNSNGQVGINLFSREKGFPDKYDLAARHLLAKIDKNSCRAVFEDVPYGKYAVSVFHDENLNNKIDGNLIGMPKEGVATSNNVRPKFAPPKFKDAVFTHDSSKKTLDIKMIYFLKGPKER